MDVRPTLAVADFAPVFLVVAGNTEPSNPDMDAAIAKARSLGHSLYLIYAGNVSLNAYQRKQIATLGQKQKLRAAVLLGSAITRGAVTALTWLTGQDQFRAFALGEVGPALEYLGLPVSKAPTFQRAIDDARAAIAKMHASAQAG